MLFPHESLPLIQLFLLPLIVAALWFLRVGKVAAPKLLLLAALLLTCAAFWVGYSIRSLTGKRIVIARFSDDSLAADSRIFRENVERRLNSISESRVLRVSKSFRSLSELKKRFPNARHHDAVVAGSRDSLLIYFPAGRGVSGYKDLDRIKQRIGYEIVSHPASITVGNPNEAGTAAFVADLLAAFSMKPEHGDELQARQELLYAGAARIEARWKSRMHRALPAWLLGNGALLRAFSASQVQMPELDCALKWYSYAAGLFKPGDNPELAGAIYNNWGVAMALRGWLGGHPDDLRQAALLFKRGRKTETFPVAADMQLRSWQSARNNLLTLARGRSPKGIPLSAQNREAQFWKRQKLAKDENAISSTKVELRKR